MSGPDSGDQPSRLAGNLTGALTSNAEQAVAAGITSPDTFVPAAVQAAGEPLKTAIIDAYANSLASVFWYLVPILGVALLLALALKEIPLSKPADVENVVIIEDRDDDPREVPVHA